MQCTADDKDANAEHNDDDGGGTTFTLGHGPGIDLGRADTEGEGKWMGQEGRRGRAGWWDKGQDADDKQ